jgi:hypothetical protein
MPAALAGSRDFTLKNGDCSISIVPNAIQVVVGAMVAKAKAPAKKKAK